LPFWVFMQMFYFADNQHIHTYTSLNGKPWRVPCQKLVSSVPAYIDDYFLQHEHRSRPCTWENKTKQYIQEAPPKEQDWKGAYNGICCPNPILKDVALVTGKQKNITLKYLASIKLFLYARLLNLSSQLLYEARIKIPILQIGKLRLIKKKQGTFPKMTDDSKPQSVLL
jgi:hypothetical protein